MLVAVMRRPAILGALVLGALVALGVVLLVARRERSDPARCPDGLVAQGFRCCAPGQRLASGSCSGAPAGCPDGFSVTPRGCVVAPRRVRIEGGTLTVSPSDWEAEGVVARTLRVASFELDASEVTHARWSACAESGGCRKLDAMEPGLPVSAVSADEAEKLCLAAGGRLPSADEWLFAAAGTSARRFPWGQTGLVCRRASFGLVGGPCGAGATGPELAGARPDGKSPEGVLDLAGNVAEWAREPDGSARAHGGSFRSRVAGELKSWAVEAVSGPADHVGFRCAYPLPAH